MPEPLREAWIADVVPGRTFAEVGGLWGVVNEQVTVAGGAGASELTMIDVAPEGGPEDLWQAFRARLADNGLSNVDCVRGSIDDPTVVELGRLL